MKKTPPEVAQSWTDSLPTLPVEQLPELFPREAKRTSQPGRTLRRTVERQRFANVASTDKAVEQIAPLPQPGEHVHLLLAPSAFSAFDILPAILHLAQQPAAQVLILTLGISQRHVLALRDLADAAQVRHVRLIVSDYFRGADRLEFEAIAAVFNERPDFELAVARNHCKVIAAELADGTRYVAYGSSNARTCRNFENMSIANDGELYAWYDRFAQDLLGGKA